MQSEDQQRIVAFANQIGEAHLDPYETAQLRGWLNEEGAVTEEGETLLKSLEDQKATPTVFRGNF